MWNEPRYRNYESSHLYIQPSHLCRDTSASKPVTAESIVDIIYPVQLLTVQCSLSTLPGFAQVFLRIAMALATHSWRPQMQPLLLRMLVFLTAVAVNPPSFINPSHHRLPKTLICSRSSSRNGTWGQSHTRSELELDGVAQLDIMYKHTTQSHHNGLTCLLYDLKRWLHDICNILIYMRRHRMTDVSKGVSWLWLAADKLDNL